MTSSNELPSTFVKLTKQHTGPIYALKFNYTGEYVMTASQDRSVSLYNPSKNIMIKNYKNLHNYDVSCIDILKDNTKFCTGGGDKLIMVMDVLQGSFCINIQANKLESTQAIMEELTAFHIQQIKT